MDKLRALESCAAVADSGGRIADIFETVRHPAVDSTRHTASSGPEASLPRPFNGTSFNDRYLEAPITEATPLVMRRGTDGMD